MTVVVNGVQTELGPGATVAAALAVAGHPPSATGIAVAVNGEVVPKGAWTTTPLGEQDRVEVLGAAQGG
jgi:sulfur carrier protein